MGAEISQDALATLLAAAAVDPLARPRFASALLASTLYVLGSVDRPIVDGVVAPGTNLRLAHLTYGDERRIPMFTSMAMLERTLQAMPGLDRSFLRLNCRELWAMTSGETFQLDPHGEYGKTYRRAEIASMLAGDEVGLEQRVVQEQTSVMVGSPAHVPPRLIPVLAGFFAGKSGVAAARLGWIAHPDGASGYLLTVAAEDRDSAMAGFGSLQIGDVTDGHTIDVVVESERQSHRLLDSITPFYVRGRPGAATGAPS